MAKRSQSEQDLLWHFERLFWFEFYLQYLRKCRSNEIEQIEKIAGAIEEEYVNKSMSGHIFPSLADDELGGVYEVLFDCFQFNLKIGERARTKNYNSLFFLKKLYKHFDDNRETCHISPMNYRYSDLLEANDLEYVMEWWSKLRDSEERKQHNLEGSYGTIGKIEREPNKEDEILYSELDLGPLPEKIREINVLTFPFCCPPAVSFQKSNFEIKGMSGEGKEIPDQLVLSVNIKEDCSNIDEILEKFKDRLIGLQARHYTNEMKVGRIPNFNLVEGKEECEIKNKGERVLINREDSVNKFLTGLYCYDFYRKENKEIGGNRINLEEAADKTSHAFKGRSCQELDIDIIKKNYDTVRRTIEINVKNWDQSSNQ